MAEGWRGFFTGLTGQRHALEHRAVIYSLVILGVLGLLQFSAYLVFPNLASYWVWLIYIDLAVISIGAAAWHVASHKGGLACMPGMMVGMTFGMQTGLMVGAIVAANNGLIVGAFAGMISGMAAGVYNGRDFGMMGIMEGLMAGMMNGIMGAMIGIMFFFDNILLFMPFFIAANLIIMWGLSLLVFEQHSGQEKKPAPFAGLLIFCIAASALLAALIVAGPRTGFAGVIAR